MYIAQLRRTAGAYEERGKKRRVGCSRCGEMSARLVEARTKRGASLAMASWPYEVTPSGSVASCSGRGGLQGKHGRGRFDAGRHVAERIDHTPALEAPPNLQGSTAVLCS